MGVVGVLLVATVAIALALYVWLSGGDDESQLETQPAAPGWIVYESEQDDYAVSFPAEPAVRAGQIGVAGEILDIRIASVTQGEFEYAVTALKLSTELPEQVNLATVLVEQNVNNGAWTIESQRETVVDGRDAVEVTYTAGEEAAVLRAITVGRDRAYTVALADTNGPTPPLADAAAFLDSLVVGD
jgi:hypothetical protein